MCRTGAPSKVVRSTGVLPDGDYTDFAWRALRKFHNVPSCTSTIIKERGVPKKHERNVRKQMEQLRFALVQAREYFEAAETASAATKPLQLYYCCMSLALAEILWKGDGEHSLDKLRATHRHHGLISTFPQISNSDLLQRSSHLVAKPMLVNGYRLGTFEVWHRLSRQTPLIGVQTTYHDVGGTETGPSVLFVSEDVQFDPIPLKGISLFDCLVRLPGLVRPLRDFGIRSVLLRTHMNRAVVMKNGVAETVTYSVDVQPHDKDRIESLRHQLLFDPNAVDRITSFDYPSGFNVKWSFSPHFGSYSCDFPEGFSYTKNAVFLLDDMEFLNEYGFLYVALYIMGMFARYFPDLWIREVESNTDFAIVVEYLLDYARWRLPVLALGELTGTVFVLNE